MNVLTNSKRLTSCTVLLFASSYLSFAQPFLHYSKTLDDDERNVDVYRINLQSGLAEVAVRDVGRILRTFIDRNQTRLFVQGRGYLKVIDLKDPTLQKVLLEGIEWVHDVTDHAQSNRLYVSVGTEDSYRQTFVFDLTTLDSIGIIKKFMSFHRPFLSKDGSRFFRFIPDSIKIMFDIYECATGARILQRKRCGKLGPFAYLADFSDSKEGKAIVVFDATTDPNFAGQHYVLCDPENGTLDAPIPFPWRSQAHLSADARYVIIEQVDFDKSRPNAEYRPGNVYVFDATTGMLRQSLKLPPEGEILVFDNYAERMYYYVSGTQQSQSIDVTIEAPTDALLGNLISAKHQAESNHWLGDANFVKELDNGLDNAKKHLAKGDSVNCAKELTVFQTKVKGVYDKKSAQGSERFVTEEAYKQLYFNAQYLVDRLPKK